MLRAAKSTLVPLALLLVAGCSSDESPKEIAALDDTLLGKGNATDPALTSALEDQIMVDPALTTQSNQHSVRAPDQPLQAPLPTEAAGGPPPIGNRPTLGQTVAKQAAKPAPAPKIASATPLPTATTPVSSRQGKFDGCGLNVSYSIGWSARMPADLPLYPKSRVAEAAGSDQGACRLRAVTFATAAAPRDVVNYYLSTARTAGYAAEVGTENGEQVVAGHRADGAAFYVVVSARDSGGSIADIVANRGS